MCTGAAVLFVGMFLAPVLGMSEKLGELTLAKLAWAFYWMLGAIVWLLRPCLARAKYIRIELEELGPR